MCYIVAGSLVKCAVSGSLSKDNLTVKGKAVVGTSICLVTSKKILFTAI